MKTTMKTPRLLSLLLTMATMFCLAAFTACSDKNEDEPEKPDTPSVPTTPSGDEFTVKATGGTVEKGDITITFPSGTFANDAKVYVKEVTKGEIRGEDEVSTFYQVMMPVASNRTTTINIKSNQTDDDIIMVAHSLASSLSGETNFVDMPLDATYKEGVYTAELPIFDNDADATHLGTITFGLTHSASAKTSNARNASTRSEENGTFVFNFDWGSRQAAHDNIELQERIESYLYEAVGIINGLGIKVEGDRKVPIIIQKDKGHGGKTLVPDEYGRYEIGQWSRKHGYILINDGFRSQEEPDMFDTNTLRKTIIHELFHYFQTDYDPRSDFWKGGYFFGDMNGEYLMLYEAGGVWIEQFMSSDGFSSIFIAEPERGPSTVRGLCYVTGGNQQSIGYGQALFLQYMTKKKGNKAVGTLLETWNKNSGQTALHIYKAWAKEIGEDLFATNVGMDRFEDFLKAAATREVDLEFAFPVILNGSTYNNDKRQVNTDGTTTYQGNVYPYGGRYAQYLIWNYANNKGENSLKGKQLIFKETNKDVRTVVYYFNNNEYIYLGSFWQSADLIISDETTLQKLRSSNSFGRHMIYMLTYSDDNAKTYPSEITVTLGDADKLELKPEELTFEASAGTQNVTADTNMDDISVEPSDKSWLTATYDKTGKIITVSATENTGESKRDGIITVTGKNGDNTIVKTIKVTQAAGVLKDFITLKRLEFGARPEPFAQNVGYTTFDRGEFVYNSYYDDDPGTITSTREGDYQIITVTRQINTFDQGGRDENFTLTVKFTKDFVVEGSFSITRKTWAGAGNPTISSTCNMSMSGTFGPQKDPGMYSGIRGFYGKPTTYSFSVGGFKAYFWDTNEIKDFGTFSTSICDFVSVTMRF